MVVVGTTVVAEEARALVIDWLHAEQSTSRVTYRSSVKDIRRGSYSEV